MDLPTLLNTVPEDLKWFILFMNSILDDWNYKLESKDNNVYKIDKHDHKYFVEVVGKNLLFFIFWKNIQLILK